MIGKILVDRNIDDLRTERPKREEVTTIK